ncbi:BrnA antitoxin family protein [uncultured Bdellovibrio sp.]|uniref:BrnA antitoxin family protein n=1 Tax=Bdellovibrio sp. HCB-162 TaxID=3394234 RepID=UPI0025DDDAC0|nr:BrnA antitoxin family protein [uncultured Bdellovibrio sp.]
MKKEYDFSKAKRGKVAKEVKVLKTVRLDSDVLQWLEEEGEKQGMGYQTFLNWFLKKSMGNEISLEERISKLEKAVFTKKA